MTTLVTGATGNVGRQVVRQLVAAGESPRAMTRNPANASLGDGVDVVAGDLSSAEAIRHACEGATALFLLGMLAFDSPIVQLAAEAGVGRIVTMTTDAVTEGIDMGAYTAVEKEVEASGLEWTHVRPGEFMANKRDQWASTIRQESVVRTAYPDVIGAPIHEADIAAVAVTALRNDGHHGQAYRPTGKQISHRQQVAAIAEVIGRPIKVERVTHTRERDSIIALGTPPWAVDHVLSYYVRWVDEPCEATDEVERVTAAPPRDFASWVRDHAADFG